MSHISYHPAPGLAAYGMGDLVAGMFVVPQNPIIPIRRSVGMADFVAGKFIVPQNPILAVVGKPHGIQGVGSCCGGCDGGGGCSGGEGYINGFGVDSGRKAPTSMNGFLEDVQGTLTTPIDIGFASVPTWALIGAGAVAVLFLTGRGSGYKSAMSSARAKYPTRYGRARRAIAAAADSY